MCDDETSKNYVRSTPDLYSEDTLLNSVIIADQPLIQASLVSTPEMPPDGEFSSLAELADKVVKPNLEETADFEESSEYE